MTSEIKNIYSSIVELYNDYDGLTPLQKLEQDEKINEFLNKTFHQDTSKVKLDNSPAIISSILPNKIKARANYSAESGEGFEDGYTATYDLLIVNYDVQFGGTLYETVRLIHNGSMVEISGEINSVKIQRHYEQTTNQNVWYSYWFDISLRLSSISTIKGKKLKASLIGASTPKNSSCFIATAAFGHNDKIEVFKLRIFRDDILLNKTLGRLFIKCYVFLSPPIASFIRTRPFFRKIIRALIRKLVLPWV